MKRAIALFALIFFCTTLIAQEEVTFNFSYKEKRSYAKTTVIMYVNGTEAVRLKNGSSFIYKATLDVNQPVTVMAKYRKIIKQEITFRLSPGNKCSLEASIYGGTLDLNLLSGGSVAPGTGSKSSLLVNKKDLSVSYMLEKTLASDTIRLQWLEKGGKIKGMSYIGGATFTMMKESGMKMTGYGGQFALTQTYLNFKIPENKPGIRTWGSFVYGFSEVFQIYGDKTTIEMEGMDPTTSSSFSFNELISPDIGYTLGLGKFKNATKWKGVAFELTYRPSLNYGTSISTNPVTGEAVVVHSTSFNYMGFSFDINFNSYTSNASRLAPKAQSKFTFFLLPPIKKVPLFISVGYGLTFYIKRK
jgi:hypothetical protein